MALAFLFDPNKQFQNPNGTNAVGGFLRVYLNGTDDAATTYKDFNGTLNEADIELDANGRAVVIADNTKTYRLEVYSFGGTLMWTVNNFTAQGGSGGSVFPISVNGTEDEIDVDQYSSGGVKYFVVGLAQAIKNSLTSLASSVTYLASGLAGKKDRQSPVSVSGGTTKTLVGISQDSDGVMTAEFDDIDFPDYSQRFENIENEQSVDSKVIAAALNDLNARMESVEDSQCDKNIGERIADALDSQNLFEGGIRVKVRQAAKSLDGTTNKTVTNISQDENGVITVTYSAISFPDWTSTITAATDLCEKLANKKTTFSGFETSNTYYPTLKAVVEYLDGRLQNLGGKKITNNGQPFTSDSQLPSSTPYYGQNINTDDYAFVQDTGLASRYTAIVSGSSVSWSLDYEISLPVFTAEQQAAIDSGVNSTKVGNYDNHLSDTGNPHNVTAAQVGAVRYDTASQGLTSTQKQNARTNIGAGTYSVPSGGIPKTDLASGVQSSLDKADSALQNHQSVVNSAPTLSWGNTSTVGSVGGTALTVKMPSNPATGKLDTNGDGSDVTASFTTAGSRNNISTGEKLSVIFSKIAKWLDDLKAVAFSGSYNDLSGTPTIPTKTSQLTNNSDFTTNAALTSGLATKQNTISDLATIRSGASAGSTALQPTGNGSNVTSTFLEAGTRSNIASGESLSTIFGKIKKFFSDLKSVAFSGSYSDLSGTPTIPEAATSTPQPVSSSAGSTGSSDYYAKGDHVHKIVVGEGVNNGQVSIAGQSVSVKGWDSIYQNYMRTSSGTKSLSFGSTTTIGSVNGSNVVLSMPQANFISKELDTAPSFPLSVCKFVALESVPGGGTYHLYRASDVCDSFKTQIGLDWGISATDYDGKANKATNDALGNNIVTTYATKTELSDTATGLGNSLSSAVNGIYDSMNKGCVRSAFDYESIAGKFTDVFSVKRESTSIVEAVVRLKVWGKYSYISATTDHTFCADITVQIRGESGNSNWTSAIADGCILYKGSTSSVSDLRVKMTTDSDNRLYISILAANASVSYTRMIVESDFMTTNQERATFSNLVSIYGSVPAGRSAIGDEFSLT